MYIYNV